MGATVVAGPYSTGECSGTAAIVGYHTTVHTYSIDCQSVSSGNDQWNAGEGMVNPDPTKVGVRFGQNNMTCGTGYGTFLKVFYECPCPTGGPVKEFETPERHMKCKKCCP